MTPLVKSVALTLSLGLLPWAAQAAYPEKPITYVVPYAPGGTNDNIARVLSEFLGAELGQPLVIENKPGAGGTLGASFVAKSAPDGYTLFNASIGNLVIAPQLVPVNFDPFKDFTPIANIAESRSVIAINPKLPIKTLADLIAYAKANPGKLSFSSSGIGTPGHIALEYLQVLAGISLVHVPYKGSAPALSDTISGHVDLIADPLANGAVKSGHLRGLAWFGGTADEKELPGVPSLLDSFPQWNFSGAFLAVAPSQTPPDILKRLRQAFDRVLAKPEVIDKLKLMGLTPQRLSVEDTLSILRATHDTSADIIRRANIKAQ
ncbi:tripartite-type tricarboxylate transporter receptor subunit TctC [Azomonas agilis]|uniref:Tripartite-type tricarboxylate transporter receptor subunit TctC n=1 Tax=Azomonas agilis TaxID=116849 RepID=A0A562I1J7_9GAMM|nr:tripartite tricarboxylate transporter substrate binding protein [Azomonas agilis]TWH64822.1 tripartite-type tricarboxylate transporter receptor subunit TctC [Azomonas agilis]